MKLIAKLFYCIDLNQGASIEDIQEVKKLAHTLDIFRTFWSRSIPDRFSYYSK